MSWHLGAAFGQTTSELNFEGDVDAELEQRVVMAALDLILDFGLRFGVAAGAVLGGELSAAGGTAELGTGWTASARAGYRVIDPEGWVPFVDTDITFTYASTPIDTASGGSTTTLTARDLRIGATVGVTKLAPVIPFLRAAVFAGPVNWDNGQIERVGGDRHKYQVGVGVAVALFERYDLVVDWAPIGEQKIVAGVGVRF